MHCVSLKWCSPSSNRKKEKEISMRRQHKRDDWEIFTIKVFMNVKAEMMGVKTYFQSTMFIESVVLVEYELPTLVIILFNFYTLCEYAVLVVHFVVQTGKTTFFHCRYIHMWQWCEWLPANTVWSVCATMCTVKTVEASFIDVRDWLPNCPSGPLFQLCYATHLISLKHFVHGTIDLPGPG